MVYFMDNVQKFVEFCIVQCQLLLNLKIYLVSLTDFIMLSLIIFSISIFFIDNILIKKILFTIILQEISEAINKTYLR